MTKASLRTSGYVDRFLFGLLLLVSGGVWAQAPSVSNLTPRGAERGKAVTLIVEGANLLPDPELVVGLSSFLALVTHEDALKPQANRLAFHLDLNANEAPGPQVLRVRTHQGLSNPVIFMVGTLPEGAEEEPNDTPPQAKPIALPLTINGHLGPTDRDTFRFAAIAGQRLVFEAAARRIGSAVDPTLRLMRMDGRELALSEDAYGLDVDARIDYKFEAAGDYLIQIHDAMYLGRAPDFYRLKAGSFPYAEAIFPLGGRAGSEVEVLLEGGNLEAAVAERLRLAPGALERLTLASLPPAFDAGAGVPFPLRVGSLPETFESVREKPDVILTLLPSTTLNGRIAGAGEVDRYGLDVVPGQVWVFEVEAASLGSWLDPVLVIYDEKGSRLSLVDDSGGLDPRLEFTVPAGVSRLTVAVEDLHRRGGKSYGYRLTAAPQRPDFSLKLNTPQVNLPLNGTALVEVECTRRAYGGPIRLFVAAVPMGFSMRGGEILPDQTKGCLTLTGPGAAEFRYLELEVLGGGGTPVDPILRRAEGTIFLASDQNVPVSPLRQSRVACAVVEPPPFAVKAEVDLVDVVVGHAVAVPMDAVRAQGVEAEIKLTGIGAPPGVAVQEGKIPEKQAKGAVTLAAAPNAALREGDVVVAGAAKVNNADIVVPTPVFRVRVVEPFSLTLSGGGGGGGVLKVARGAKTAFEGKLVRVSPFAGQVDLRLEGLPQGVMAAAVSVPPDKVDFKLELGAEAAAVVGEVEIKLVASTPLGDPKQPIVHAIPPSPFKLAVAEAGAAQ